MLAVFGLLPWPLEARHTTEDEDEEEEEEGTAFSSPAAGKSSKASGSLQGRARQNR